MSKLEFGTSERIPPLLLTPNPRKAPAKRGHIVAATLCPAMCPWMRQSVPLPSGFFNICCLIEMIAFLEPNHLGCALSFRGTDSIWSQTLRTRRSNCGTSGSFRATTQWRWAALHWRLQLAYLLLESLPPNRAQNVFRYFDTSVKRNKRKLMSKRWYLLCLLLAANRLLDTPLL